MIGDEWPGGSGVFQIRFLSGPNSDGIGPSATPEPLGPRKRDQSGRAGGAAMLSAVTPSESAISVRFRPMGDISTISRSRAGGSRLAGVTTNNPPLVVEVARRLRPSREFEFEPGFEKPASHNPAALQNQLCLGSQKQCANF